MSERLFKRKCRVARRRWYKKKQQQQSVAIPAAASRCVKLDALEPRLLLSAAPSAGEAMQLFNTSPAVFVENQGQWEDSSIAYLFQGSGANIAFTDQGPMFQVFKREAIDDAAAFDETQDTEPFDPLADRLGEEQDYTTEVAEFSVRFDGANTVAPTGVNQSESYFNYMLGDTTQHRSNVPGYEIVAYENLYEGIDLHTFGKRDSLKYEFYVAPGSDYTQIEVSYDGIAGLSIDKSGAMHVSLPGEGWADLVDDAPYIYQLIDGVEVEVAGEFRLVDHDTYRFEITGAYDTSRELIIDPDLAWSTYLGGSSYDYGYGIATDGDGNILVTGVTHTSGWISGGYDTTYGGFYEAFVVKLSAVGGLLWSTYLGGSDDDYGRGIATDADGNVLVTGWTYSSGWAGGGYGGDGDAFVVKLSASGGLLWSTYLGGSDTDSGYGIAIDAYGSVVVTGTTSSPGWAGGSYGGGDVDAFVAQLDTYDGFLLWSTYLGGSNEEHSLGIATDADGNVLVTGWTYSSGWAGGGYGGNGDAFVVKLLPGLGLLWSTYLGGSGYDSGLGITTDTDGNVLVTGYTYSSVWAGGSYGGSIDAFVVKLSASGGMLWSTYLGGSSTEYGRGITTDADGNVLVTGNTSSPGWAGGIYSGGGDAFVVKLSASGGLHWSTYLGGSDGDAGFGITTDTDGNVLVTGLTDSSGWVGGSYGGYDDAFVVKIGNVIGTPHYIFEDLARNAAYQSWQMGNTILNVYEVDEVFPGTRGFYALGLISETYDPVLLLRGTEPNSFKDIFTDLLPEGVGWSQFRDNWEDGENIKGWLDDQRMAGKSVDITGHSLGGALTQWIAAKYTSLGHTNLDQIVTFNSPGIRENALPGSPALDSYANLFVPGNAGEVMHYIAGGDIVSMAGEAYLAGDYRLAEFFELDPIAVHGTTLLDVNGAVTGVELSEPMDVSGLNSPLFNYSVLNPLKELDYKAFLAGATVAAAAIPGNHPLAEIPVALLFRGTTEELRQNAGGLFGAIDNLINAIDLSELAEGRVRIAYDSQEGFAGQLVIEAEDLAADQVGDPPQISMDGGFSLKINQDLSINLPWLGTLFEGASIEMLALDASGHLDNEHMTLSGDLSLLGGVATLTGNVDADWAKEQLNVSGTLDILSGFVTATANAKVKGDSDLFISGTGALQVPGAWWTFGDKTFASGDFLVQFTNDGDLSNDFVAGWSSIPVIGPVGLRIWLDGRSPELIGGKTVSQIGGGSGSADGAAASGAFDVAAGTDWVLLSSEWENAMPGVEISLMSPSGQTLTEADIALDPDITIVTDLSDDTHRAVKIDSPEAGTWTISIADTTGLGNVDFNAMVSAGVPSIAFTNVAGGANHAPVQIDFDAFDVDSDAEIALFYDDDGAGLDGVLITDGLIESDGAGGYSWDTMNVAPGDYHVYAMIMDAENPPVYVYAASPVTVTDTPPTVTATSRNGGADLPSAVNSLAFTFSEDVSAGLYPFALSIVDDVTGQSVDLSGLEDTDVVWDAGTLTATWDLSQITIEPGDYTATLKADQVLDSWGQELDGDGDGTAGDDFSLALKVTIAGDADQDGDVDTGDITTAIINFTGAGGTGKTSAEGDTDGDGDVDTNDITNAVINFTGAGGGAGSGDAAASSSSLQGLLEYLDAMSSGANLAGEDEAGEDPLVADRVLAV